MIPPFGDTKSTFNLKMLRILRNFVTLQKLEKYWGKIYHFHRNGMGYSSMENSMKQTIFCLNPSLTIQLQ